MQKNYDIFMIDPPWPQTRGGKKRVSPNTHKPLPYKVMPIKDIFKLLDDDIFSLASPNKHTVFMWAIDKFLQEIEEEMRNRKYKLHARLIWNKLNGPCPGFSIRYSHEYLLWYYKPRMTPLDKNYVGKFSSVLVEKSREHSRKPECAYDMINKMYPKEKKMDVFCREIRDGWDQYGDEIDKF